MCDGNGHGRVADGTEGRTTVEAEPADPEHSGSGYAHRQVMRRHSRLGVTVARANHDAGDKRADAGSNMNDDATGEIKDAHIGEIATGATPSHMTDRCVDHDQPK